MSADALTFLNGYDAAGQQYDGQRSLLIFPTNSRQEHHRGTRRSLLVKARALESNFPFITRLRSKFGRCVAGKGIFPQPITRDSAWNILAKDFFERWASNPYSYSIDGSRDLWEDQKLVAEELGAGDGEFFEAMVRRDGAPMIQPLDPMEIQSPEDDRLSLFEDGVRADPFLRPIGYSVRELCAPGARSVQSPWREIASQDMIHLFRRRRAKQFRGLPPLYSSFNDAHDALDTLALEKATTKLHSLLAAIKVRKPANKGQGITNSLERILGDDGTVEKLAERFKGGAVTVEVDEGEDVKLLTSGRPSSPVLEGIRFYCMLVALGADLPLSVVMGFVGLGGTATRGDLEDAQGTFEMNQDRVVWRHSQRIYTWRLAIAQKYGELPRCADPYWWASDWHGPAKITVDYGRSADANISLVRAGMLSVPRYAEERGNNADAEVDKQIAWLKRTQEKCDAAGVPFERVIEPTPGAVTNIKLPPNPEP